MLAFPRNPKKEKVATPQEERIFTPLTRKVRLGGQAFEGCDGEKPNSQVWHGIRTHASCGVRRPRNNRSGSVLDGAAVRHRGALTDHPQDLLSRQDVRYHHSTLV